DELPILTKRLRQVVAKVHRLAGYVHESLTGHRACTVAGTAESGLHRERAPSHLTPLSRPPYQRIECRAGDGVIRAVPRDAGGSASWPPSCSSTMTRPCSLGRCVRRSPLRPTGSRWLPPAPKGSSGSVPGLRTSFSSTWAC